MELVICVVAAVAAIAAAAGVWFRKPGAQNGDFEERAADLKAAIADSERRLQECVYRLQTAMEGALRDSAQQSAKAQTDLALNITKQVGESGTALLSKVSEQFQSLAQTQTTTFAKFHTHQAETTTGHQQTLDNRLGALEKSMRDFSEKLSGNISSLNTSLLEKAKVQAEQDAAAAKGLSEELALKLDGGRAATAAVLEKLQVGIAEQLTAIRKENLEVLGQARLSLDSRLVVLDETLKKLSLELTKAISDLQTSLSKASHESASASTKSIIDLSERLGKKVEELRTATSESLIKVQQGVQEKLEAVRKDNEEKLEKIRNTVETKLQETLEKRLGESFKLVSERLEQVHQGLGEMKNLAEGVGDLKKVLTNVRSRGTFGEVQLEALLEQIFTPAQYEKNVAVRPGSSERVEFAVRLPGRDDDKSVLYLPIDAKFPQEDYLRLTSAFESGDAAAVDAARKGLRARLVIEARTICEKYVCPPHTTDFALLFVPTEGLYAEALRMDNLTDEIQRECRVILVGPTTLYAILSSLQMGFRTLAIEKRSSEVWKVLGAVKTEFGKFGESLEAVSKKLSEASSKIDMSARRSRAVERKLREVEELPVPEAAVILMGADGDGLDLERDEEV
jgi:DNA recombination protein RmuC